MKSLSCCSIFCLVSLTRATDLAYVPYRSLCFALGSVTLYGSDLPASATAACRETAVFYRDRVEPSRRSRGGVRERKKTSNGGFKRKDC